VVAKVLQAAPSIPVVEHKLVVYSVLVSETFAFATVALP